jgi:hypothetical protein
MSAKGYYKFGGEALKSLLLSNFLAIDCELPKELSAQIDQILLIVYEQGKLVGHL